MSVDDGLSNFLGGLYEAVFDADEWRSAMVEVARRSGSSTLSIATTDLRAGDIVDLKMVGSEASAVDDAAREYVEGMYAIDPAFKWIHRHPGACACESTAVIPPSDYHDHEFVKWTRSRFGTSHWSVLYTEPVDDLSFTVTFLGANDDETPSRQESALRSLLFENVERAIRLAARPPNFASDDSALIAVDSHGRPLSMSPRAEVLLRDDRSLFIRHGLLTAQDRQTARMIAHAIRSAIDPSCGEQPGRGIRIARASGKPDLLLVVSVLPRALDHVPTPVPAALVRLIELESSPAFLREHAHLFDLTPREIEIATSLLEGHSIESLSANLNLSRNTARNHIQALFRKTGTNRQSELVRMLDRLARQ
jgi:DNA-binding CsgD family transcriptional regulator